MEAPQHLNWLLEYLLLWPQMALPLDIVLGMGQAVQYQLPECVRFVGAPRVYTPEFTVCTPPFKKEYWLGDNLEVII